MASVGLVGAAAVTSPKAKRAVRSTEHPSTIHGSDGAPSPSLSGEPESMSGQGQVPEGHQPCPADNLVKDENTTIFCKYFRFAVKPERTANTG